MKPREERHRAELEGCQSQPPACMAICTQHWQPQELTHVLVPRVLIVLHEVGTSDCPWGCLPSPVPLEADLYHVTQRSSPRVGAAYSLTVKHPAATWLA